MLKTTKITPIAIPQDKYTTRTRYFVEVKIENQWRDVGNYATGKEAIDSSNSVKIIGNSWCY